MMFGVDWSDPQTLWLNLTNLALGVVTLVSLLVAIGAVARELMLKHKRARAVAGLDAELQAMFRGTSPHTMPVPGLGLTMADGGEPYKPAEEAAERKTAGARK
jgi:hypothetical protein